MGKVPTSLPLDPSNPTLRSSSSSATMASSRTWDATEVSWTRPSSTLRATLLPPRLTWDTPQAKEREEAAIPPSSLTPPSRSPPTPMSPRTTPPSSRPPLTSSQSPSPLRLTRWPSRCTPLVSSPEPTAEPTSTTVSSPSATVLRTALSTSLSRTPGAQPGETRDTSSSESRALTKPVSAVSSPDPHPTQRPTEHHESHCMQDEYVWHVDQNGHFI